VREIVLSQKVYGPWHARCLSVLERLLHSEVSGLQVDVRVQGQTSRGWVKAVVEGEDEDVALGQLSRMFGLASQSLDALEPPCTVIGYAVDVGRVGYGIFVDVGLSSELATDVLVPLHAFRAQLGDGERLSMRRIAQSYCLTDNVPLRLRLTKVDVASRRLEAQLSDGQVAVFEKLVRDGLEKVLVLGVPLEDAREAVRASGLERDVIDVESVGLFEHFFVCKLGTQAVGVISRLGRQLPGALLYIFSPHRSWLWNRISSGGGYAKLATSEQGKAESEKG
jgi:hypothetical protein